MSSILDWFSGILINLGLIKKCANLVFLGLDNAGKTTLLRVLKDDQFDQDVPPNLHPSIGKFTLDGIQINALDFGGCLQARGVWTDYFPSPDAIVFLLDVADGEQVEEAREELWKVLGNELVAAGVPVLVLGNKADKKPNAMSEDQLKCHLGIQELCMGKGNMSRAVSAPTRRPLELFLCSALRRQGYDEAFHWLTQYLD